MAKKSDTHTRSHPFFPAEDKSRVELFFANPWKAGKSDRVVASAGIEARETTAVDSEAVRCGWRARRATKLAEVRLRFRGAGRDEKKWPIPNDEGQFPLPISNSALKNNGMKTLMLIWAILLMQSASAGPMKTVKYSTGSCQCNAQYNPAKIAPKTVEGVIALGNHPPDLVYVDARTDTSRTKDELTKRRDDELKYFKENLARLKKLSLPKEKNWDTARDKAIQDLELNHYLDAGTLNYLIDGKVEPLMMDFNGEKLLAECRKSAESLRSEESIRKSLPALLEQTCANNIDPLACKKSNAENPKATTLMFGWWNCANHQWRKSVEPYDDAFTRFRTAYFKETCDCDSD